MMELLGSIIEKESITDKSMNSDRDPFVLYNANITRKIGIGIHSEELCLLTLLKIVL